MFCPWFIFESPVIPSTCSKSLWNLSKNTELISYSSCYSSSSLFIWVPNPRKLIQLIHANNSMSCDKENFTCILQMVGCIDDYVLKEKMEREPQLLLFGWAWFWGADKMCVTAIIKGPSRCTRAEICILWILFRRIFVSCFGNWQWREERNVC